jgi:hypothetical protein
VIYVEFSILKRKLWKRKHLKTEWDEIYSETNFKPIIRGAPIAAADTGSSLRRGGLLNFLEIEGFSI